MSTTTIQAGELAALVGGQFVQGDPQAVLTGLNSINEAAEGDVTFLGNPKYSKTLKDTAATAALVPPNFAAMCGELPARLILVAVDNPTLAFSLVTRHFSPLERPFTPGVHPSAVVSPSAALDRGKVSIGPHVVIEDEAVIGDGTIVHAGAFVGAGARLGSDCVLHAGAIVKDRCVLGNRVIIHSCAVIGTDGFGYEFVKGRHQKIEQVGIVQIDDDVEVGSCATIDRARFGKTHIGEGTKIDNLVQIAHNVCTGRHCIIVSQVGISGSTKLGSQVVIGGQVGVAGHLTIGDQVTFLAKSGVTKDCPQPGMYTGYPARPIMEGRKVLATQARVPELLERVRELERQVEELRKTKA